jgi:ABC-type lipoprotein release transport system permease subunit
VVAGRAAASLRYETSPGDAPTLLGVTLVVAAAALAATWLPSRRATRVDPAQALRAS